MQSEMNLAFFFVCKWGIKMRFKCILLEHQVGHLHNAFSVPEKENFRRKTNNAASVMSGSFKNAPPDAQHVLVFL